MPQRASLESVNQEFNPIVERALGRVRQLLPPQFGLVYSFRPKTSGYPAMHDELSRTLRELLEDHPDPASGSFTDWVSL